MIGGHSGSEMLRRAGPNGPPSPRVQGFLAVAIRTVASRKFGWALSELDAFALAEIGDLDEALNLLAARRDVRRNISGVMLSNEEQQSIAIAEAVADHRGIHGGDPSGRIEYLRVLLEKQREDARKRDARSEATRQVERLIAESDGASAQLRKFLRKADILRSRQRNFLTQSIADPGLRSDALSRLDNVYALHLSELGGIAAPSRALSRAGKLTSWDAANG